jgi:hypothetical protein
MVDNGGDIETGIMTYSELVKAEKDKLTTEAYDKLRSTCNDDGTIILKLIKSLLDPLSTDIVKAFTGEEAGVGLHDIGSTIVETWTVLSVAKGCLEESFVTDSGENFLNIVNGGQNLFQKHHGCLGPIIQEIVYDMERHEKKFGPITLDAVVRMMFFRHVFILGKNDSTIKEYLRRIKDEREYAEAMQSWAVMTEVAEEFIFKIIQNDNTHGQEKMRKRAATLVEDQPPRSQIRNIEGGDRGGGRGRGQWRAENHGKKDHFCVMFAEKPKQFKDEKCDGCGLDPHTGDCVKKANLKWWREEMGPRIHS